MTTPAPLPVRLVPQVDRDSAPWWDSLGQHRFVLQRCLRCRAWRWPARAICGRCGSFDWSWAPASGRGTVASWTVNHHTFDPAFRSPYTVVFVRLDEQEDIVMPGSLAADTEVVSIGTPVDVEYLDVPVEDGSAVTLLAWRPRSAEGSVDG